MVKIKAGYEGAKEEMENFKEERKEELEVRREELKEKHDDYKEIKDELRESAEDGDEEAQAELKALKEKERVRTIINKNAEQKRIENRQGTQNLPQDRHPKPVARFCTEEAKVCADGSIVGRVGPECRFEKCPEVEDDDEDVE